MPLEAKSAPSSPKIEANRFLHVPKSPDGFLYPSLSERAAWASLSRDRLTNDDECESALLTDQKVADRQSLFRDLCQTQLSLWTFTVSTLLTYFWQKRVHFRTILFVIFALALTSFMSGILATVVIAAHLFNSDFAGSFGGLGDWLGDDEGKYPQLLRRQSSGRSNKSRRSSGSSGSTTPRGGDKIHQARFWQKNVSTLERTYIGSSRS